MNSDILCNILRGLVRMNINDKIEIKSNNIKYTKAAKSAILYFHYLVKNGRLAKSTLDSFDIDYEVLDHVAELVRKAPADEMEIINKVLKEIPTKDSTFLYDICENGATIVEDKTLNLINRQKAEIERLKKEAEDKERAYNDEFCLRKEWQTKCQELLEEKQITTSEAIKEFAERLKEKLQWDVEFDNKLVFESDIDNLIKEMTE